MYLVVFYVGEYVCMGGCVGVYTKSKSSELFPLRRKLLCNFLLRCARNILEQKCCIVFWPLQCIVWAWVVNLLSTLLLIMAHRFFFQCQIILCSCLTIGLFFFAYAAPSSSSFQSILDDETVDYPMGVRQSATILFPDSVGNRSEKASSSTVGGNCKKTCMLF
jgi:hypothetical protein